MQYFFFKDLKAKNELLVFGYFITTSYYFSVAPPEDARNIVLEGDLSIQDVELEPFLSFSQVVDNMDDELEIKDREYLLNNKKKHRDVWNKRCKKTEGMKYATLVKSKGRMKAAHKASLGKHVIHKIVNKNH